MSHEPFMHRCLELAALGRGRVGNGAMVGALLVRSGKIIAEGYHRGFGLPHAERDLFERFTEKILPTDILYVNLEPCCHQGKTPPCTQIVIDRGIRTVVYGMHDPDPRVSGKGRALLREQKIEVIGPVLRAQCEWFNRGYLSLRTKNRPWITLKKAQMQDGRVAHENGSRLTITSQEQNEWSHKFLRARTDAILVGSGTVLFDDPQLTVRYSNIALKEEEKSEQKNDPWRIVLEGALSAPEMAKVFTDSLRHLTILVTAQQNVTSEKAKRLQASGVVLIGVPTKNGIFDWSALWKALTTPQGDFAGITSILVEGGSKTWKNVQEAGFVDEEITLLG